VLVLNQTADEGSSYPNVPRDGGLFFPRRNKHIIFRGNLMHGVNGEAGRLNKHLPVNVKDVGKSRRTLLINWWRNKPLPPNCNDMPSNFVSQLTAHNVRLGFGPSTALNVGGMLTSGFASEEIDDLCCKQYVT
jgi:hypothetical protein